MFDIDVFTAIAGVTGGIATILLLLLFLRERKERRYTESSLRLYVTTLSQRSSEHLREREAHKETSKSRDFWYTTACGEAKDLRDAYSALEGANTRIEELERALAESDEWRAEAVPLMEESIKQFRKNNETMQKATALLNAMDTILEDEDDDECPSCGHPECPANQMDVQYPDDDLECPDGRCGRGLGGKCRC